MPRVKQKVLKPQLPLQVLNPNDKTTQTTAMFIVDNQEFFDIFQFAIYCFEKRVRSERHQQDYEHEFYKQTNQELIDFIKNIDITYNRLHEVLNYSYDDSHDDSHDDSNDDSNDDSHDDSHENKT